MEHLVEWNCKEKNSALPKQINGFGDTVGLEDICAQLATIYDIVGDMSMDRLRELVEADKAGRVLPKTSRVRKCPKCGKMNMYPRIDWKYFYCYSCETTFPAEEIIRSKAALSKDVEK